MRSLRDLADKQDTSEPATLASPSRTQAFAAAVAEKLDGRDLRYSNRLQLLTLADVLKIDRFQANLIIATVQHGRSKQIELKPRTSAFALSPVVTFLVVQTTILAAIWYLFA